MSVTRLDASIADRISAPVSDSCAGCTSFRWGNRFTEATMTGRSRLSVNSWIGIGALALSACGGGGESTPVVTTPPLPVLALQDFSAAVVGGTIEREENPSFILVNPGDGTTWLFYGPDLGSTSRATGYIFTHGGYATYGDGVPYNATDSAQAFGYGASLQVAVDPYAPTVAGSLRYLGDTTAYRLAGGAVPGSSYRYDRPADVAEAVGSWSLTDLQGESVSISVDPQGSIGGAYQGCAVSGRLTPTRKDENRMDLVASLTGCPASRNTLSSDYSGFGILFPMTGGGSQLLLFASAFDEATWSADSMFAIGRR